MRACCISYLTIELKGSIPLDLRPLIGNRVYGCDDCQLVCPWNKFAQAAPVADFDVRHGLDRATLVDLFDWSADEFDTRMQGSAIRRIGYECWLRNLAVGMGNALRADPASFSGDARAAIVDALAPARWTIRRRWCASMSNGRLKRRKQAAYSSGVPARQRAAPLRGS